MFGTRRPRRGTPVAVASLVHQNAFFPTNRNHSTYTQTTTINSELVAHLNKRGFTEDHSLDMDLCYTMVETPGNLTNMWKQCREIAVLRTVAEMIRAAIPEHWPDKQAYSALYSITDVELSEGVGVSGSNDSVPLVVITVTWMYTVQRKPEAATNALASSLLGAVKAVDGGGGSTGGDTGPRLTKEQLEQALLELQERARRESLEEERRRQEAEAARAKALAAEAAAEEARLQAEIAERARIAAEAERLRLESERQDEEERLRAAASALEASTKAAEDKAKAEALALAASLARDLAERSEQQARAQETAQKEERERARLDLEAQQLQLERVRLEREQKERDEAAMTAAAMKILEQEHRFLAGDDTAESSTDELANLLDETEEESVSINTDTEALLRYLLSGVNVTPIPSFPPSPVLVGSSPPATPVAAVRTRSPPESTNIFSALEQTGSPVLKTPSLTNMRTLMTSMYNPLSEISDDERSAIMASYVNISPLKISPKSAREARVQSTESLTQTFVNAEAQTDEQQQLAAQGSIPSTPSRSSVSMKLREYFAGTAISTAKRGMPTFFVDAVIMPSMFSRPAADTTVAVYERFRQQYQARYPDKVMSEEVVDTVLFMDLLRERVQHYINNDLYSAVEVHMNESDLSDPMLSDSIAKVRTNSNRMVLYADSLKSDARDGSWTKGEVRLATAILKSTAELAEKVTADTVASVKTGVLVHLQGTMLGLKFDNLLPYSTAVPNATEQVTEPTAWSTLEQQPRYGMAIVSRIAELESLPTPADIDKALEPFSGEINAVSDKLVSPNAESIFSGAIIAVFHKIALFYNASYRGGETINKNVEPTEARRMIRIIRGLVNPSYNSESDLKAAVYAEINAALKQYDIIISDAEVVVKWNGANIRAFVQYWTALVCASKVVGIDLAGWLPFSSTADVLVPRDDGFLYQFIREVQTLRHNKRVPPVDDNVYRQSVCAMRNLALLDPCVTYLSDVRREFFAKSLNAMEFTARLWLQESVNALRVIAMQMDAVHTAVRVYASSGGTPAFPAARTNLRAACVNFMAACDLLSVYTTNLRMVFGIYYLLTQHVLVMDTLRMQLLSTIPTDRQRFFDLLKNRPEPPKDDFSYRAYFMYFAHSVFGVNYDEKPIERFYRLFMDPHDRALYVLDALDIARARVADLISMDQYDPRALASIVQATDLRTISLFDYSTYAPDRYIAALRDEQKDSPLILVLYMGARAKYVPRFMSSQSFPRAWKIIESTDDTTYLWKLLEQERGKRASANSISSASGDGEDTNTSMVLE